MATIAVDWGSSSFRAYRFDGDRFEDKLEARCGIKTLLSGSRKIDFSSVLQVQLGDWLEPGQDILLSGMVTSAAGWIVTPYIGCPMSCADIIRGLTPLQSGDFQLYFVPGVSQESPNPDVMRGEEVQLLGLIENDSYQSRNAALIVLPGTHSKWAVLADQTINRFKTIPTGEVYSALVNHTLIGQLGVADSWCGQSFIDGVSLGYKDSDILGNLFSARSSVLLKKMDREQSHAWLSGLLIGSEIREGKNISPEQDQVTLVGTDLLTERYKIAFSSLGFTAEVADSEYGYPDVTAAGFAAIIRQLNTG